MCGYCQLISVGYSTSLSCVGCPDNAYMMIGYMFYDAGSGEGS